MSMPYTLAHEMSASSLSSRTAPSSARLPTFAAAVVLAVACTPGADRSDPPQPESDVNDRDRRLTALERDLPRLLHPGSLQRQRRELCQPGAKPQVSDE